jgi:vacuolar-type H+-ATPase subunit H
MPPNSPNACDSMEKVWSELKKIEAQAQQIKVDAQEKAKAINLQAKQDSEKLLSDSKRYGEEEAQKLYSKAIAEANGVRDAQLNENLKAAEKLKAQAQKNIDKAVDAVVKSVLED